MGHSGQRARLTRQDWIDAAIAMGGRVGFDHLAVEPLAAELGTTKGSFYWHFADRAALLDAVLAHWESAATAAIIEQVERADPDARVARLVDAAFTQSFEDVAEWRILAAAGHPQIGPVVARVHEARLAYIIRLLAATGLPRRRASARARILYASYLGHLQLISTGAVSVPGQAAMSSFRAELVALFSAP